jgi:hypothetical protein
VEDVVLPSGEKISASETELAHRELSKEEPVSMTVQKYGAALRPSQLRIGGGIHTAALQDFNSLMDYSGLSLGLSGTLEITMPLSQAWRWMAQVNYLFASGEANDSQKSQRYRHTLSAVPLVTGVDWLFWRGRTFEVGIGAELGVGLSSTVTTEVLTQSAPNRVTLHGNGFAAGGRLVFSKGFSGGPFLLWGQARYLSCSTSALAPDTYSGNAGPLYVDGTSGASLKIPIDLSGFTVNLGVGLSL